MHRLLFLLLVMGVFALALWDIWRRNPQLRRSAPPPAPRPPLRPVPPDDPDPDPAGSPAPDPAPASGGKVLAFKRDPLRTLGLSAGAGPAEIRAAHARLRAENAPERLTGMSDELQQLAARRCRQLDEARDAALAALGVEPDG